MILKIDSTCEWQNGKCINRCGNEDLIFVCCPLISIISNAPLQSAIQNHHTIPYHSNQMDHDITETKIDKGEPIDQDDQKQQQLNASYNAHLINFKWDQNWFWKLEKLMIEQSYFPDYSFQHTLEFLRTTIQQTSTDDFNFFLLQCGGPVIITHFDLLKQNPDKINWRVLSRNSNPEAINLLKQNPDKINWSFLSGNPHPEAIQLLKDNSDKINWIHLSGNPHPEAIQLLKTHPDKINWDWLSNNTCNYNTEKISKFNSLNLFPRCKLRL